jgi:3-hydroxyacyl-CoA dehydrogenase/enoyl-CoA hydratase/3-hydroxybutyryl-CoA epimerase
MSALESQTTWRPEAGPGGITTLWFDTPGRPQNVLGPAAWNGLEERLAVLEADSSLRGVLIRSAKPAGFCAGADLKTILACTSVAELEAFLRRGLDVLDRLAALPVATVAIVHGVCLGGGLELALACRRRVALASSATLQMGSPEVQLGLVPAWGAMVRLARLLAPRDALNVLLFGNPLGFLQAKSQGLVERLVAQDEHDRIAETLESKPLSFQALDEVAWDEELKFGAAKADQQPADFPEAQEAIIDLIRLDLAEGPRAAMVASLRRCAELGTMPATKHAIASFFERRRSRS